MSVRRAVAAAVMAALAASGCGSDTSPTAEPVADSTPGPVQEAVREAEEAEEDSTSAAEPVADSTPGLVQELGQEAEESIQEDSTPSDESIGDGLFPIVVAAQASAGGGTSWHVAVTLSSEYDTPERYADAWRVLDADDNELGIRILGHDHANEQPFTRSTSVEIPEELTVVYIEGRDQHNGWSGERFELVLPG